MKIGISTYILMDENQAPILNFVIVIIVILMVDDAACIHSRLRATNLTISVARNLKERKCDPKRVSRLARKKINSRRAGTTVLQVFRSGQDMEVYECD
jgi:hypothetical protein